jgi:ADP-heptose:LPS heptosyltransferase
VAAAIRVAFPHTRLDWLVDVRHHDVVELVSVVNGAIPVDTSSAHSLSRVVREMRSTAYDIAFDLQGLLKSALLARLSGATRVIGFTSDLLRERPARVFYTETGGVAARHVIDKNLSLLSAIGVRVPDVAFPLEDRHPEVVIEARARLSIRPDHRFALINPGAAWPNKRWPAVYFAEVSRELARRHGLRSLVLWGPGDEEVAHTVAAASDNTAVLSPPTRIADLVSLSKAAALMISGDTGPMHIAAACGTPVIGIFGPTDPQRNGPWSEDDLVASRFGSCACHYQRHCRTSNWCLLDIAPREVMELVDRRLTSA